MARRFRALALVAVAVVAAASASSPPVLQLVLRSDASYDVLVAGQRWFTSADTRFAVGGVAYSAASGTLKLTGNTSSSGSNALGPFTATTYAWQAGDAAATTLHTTFYAYDGGAILGFQQAFPAGTASQGAPPAATAGVVATFPSLAATPATPAPLGSLYQDPASGNCGWTVEGSATFPAPSGGLLVMSPAVTAASPAAARTSLAFAALDQQPVVRQVAAPLPAPASGHALAAGPGAEFDLPAGFSATTILVASVAPPPAAEGGASAADAGAAQAGSPVPASRASFAPASVSRADMGMPAGGVNDALFALGDALLRSVGKSRPPMNADPMHERLGYSTVGFYFYNPCDA
jgi:hypothetical protein